MVGLQPVTFVRSSVDQHGRRVGGFQAVLLDQADAARRRTRRGAPAVVWDATSALDERTMSPEVAYQIAAEGSWARVEHAQPFRGSVLSVR